MATQTIDQRSPGARKVQNYHVFGGLDGNRGDQEGQESKEISFKLLKNCLIDKRLNAVVKKPGSVVETISGTLGIPLGIAEHIKSANDSLIPIRRSILANFSGSSWKQNNSGTWSDVTVDSGLSFATSRPSTFTQLGSRLYIAAGLPAYWEGPGTTIKRVGIPASTSQIGITSYNTGSGITLSQGTSYVFTYYNASTGLESDWSPPSATVPVITNQSIVIAIPATVAGNNYDSLRIYRYLDGGTFPYLVTQVAVGATTYTDSKPDSQLTTRIAPRYRNSVPPSQTYVIAAYAQCLWVVDASDPYKLCFSRPFTGSNNDPEYFPTDQYVRTSQPITALLVTSSQMLVFHPRSISIITGSSSDDFDLKPLIPGIGTVFAQSVSTNGTDIVFLSEQGFISVTFGGGNRIHLSREIDLDLQPLLAGSYNVAIYASSVWNPSLRQFIFAVSALSNANALWEEVGTGSTADAVAGWQTSPGGVTDVWENAGSVVTTTQTRVKIWGWSPELSSPEQGNRWMEYTFPTSLDQNSDGAYITSLVHPSPSSDSNDPQQDKTYIGYYNGTVGKILSAFRRDTNTDNSSAITAELITNRICPGNLDGGYKLFHHLGFHNTYSDPTSDGSGVLSYLIDYDDPHLRSYSSNLTAFNTAALDRKKFPTMRARHIHLYLTDTSQSQSKILLSEFFIDYRERMRKEGR